MATSVFGAIMGILSLIGLLISSRAEDTTMYVIGLLLFVFSIAIIFGLIHRITGQPR
jgi:hypothetical protein